MKDNLKRTPKLYDRNYEQLFKEFKILASQFTPEWKFDENGNDFGVTLAKIFCEMQEDTIYRLNQSLSNIYVTFLNMIGISPLHRSPAKGLIEIKTAENSICSNIKKGSTLSYNDLVFETSEDIFVSSNSLEKIFMTDSDRKKIVKIFERKEEKDSKFEQFQIFNFERFKNLQSTEMYICDDYMFDSDNLNLKFKFENSVSQNSEKKISEFFVNSKWQYFDESDSLWKDLDKISRDDNSFINVKFKNRIGKSKILSNESRYIKITFPEKKNLELTGISYCSEPKNITATEFLSGEEEIDKKEFFPFKEKYYIYDCFYIKCDEALTKPGADISLSADVDFVKFEGNIQNVNKHYKMIMTDIDFADSEPDNIGIESVVWEYWKGNAWALLKTDEKFFAPSDIGKKRSINFACPSDASSIEVGPKSGLFIRARITKIRNQFSTNSNYLTPLMTNVVINYNYKNFQKLKNIVTKSDLEWKSFSFLDQDERPLNIFNKEDNNFPSIYLKFRNSISQGVFNIFFDIEKIDSYETPLLNWMYWSKESDNSFKWKKLDIIDFTNNFSKSGIVKILGSDSFVKRDLFGESGFFIKISSENGLDNNKYFPTIKDIKLNVVKIIQKESKPYEYFSISLNEKNKVCSLSSKNIYDVAVWVDENSKTFFSEEEIIKKQNENIIEIEGENQNERMWVKWNEVSNISNAGPKDRVYEVNYDESQIIFGDGICGKIPPEQISESIRVKYSTTEGQKGNINAGFIESFDSVFPSVVGVSNFIPTYDGLDPESLDHAAMRTFDEISRGKRIISSTGLESAIMFNNRNVFKVKCFPHTNKYGDKSYGDITIVILPYERMQKKKFGTLKREVEEFLNKNSFFGLLNKNITIREVEYVEFYINLDISVNSLDNYQEVTKRVDLNIKKFLDPIKGGRKNNGFEIGMIPSDKEILGNINFLQGIKRIERIIVFTKVLDEYGRSRDILFSDAQKLKFGAPVFKNLDIKIKV